MAEQQQSIIALAADLIFGSRISATARAEEIALRIVRKPEALAEADGQRLLVDIDLPGAIEAATQWKARTGGTVIAFASHVNADAIARARAAGFDQVLPRSAFVTALPRLLRGED